MSVQEKDGGSRANSGGGSATVTPLRVGWIGSTRTMEMFGRVLGPLAIGLVDELVGLFVFCPEAAVTTDLPSPPCTIVPHRRLRWGIFHAAALKKLEEDITPRKLHLIHALDAESAWLARRLAQSLKVNYVISSSSLADGRRLGLLHRHAASVVAMSRSIMEDLIKHHVAPAERICLMQPGVYQVHHPMTLRQPGHSAAIVAGGSEHDGHELLGAIQAFGELRKEGHDCQFFVIVRGRWERRLRKEAEKLDLRHHLTFVDPEPAARLPGIFKAADIYISAAPSKRVDMGSLLAMAAGVPVLVAKGSVGDFLLDGQTIMHFAPGDSDEIAQKLSCLLREPASAAAMVGKALAYLQKHHSPAQMVAFLSKLYHRCLDKKTKARLTSKPSPAA